MTYVATSRKSNYKREDLYNEENKDDNYAFMSVILSAKIMSCFSAPGGFVPRSSQAPTGAQPLNPAGGLCPADPLDFVPSWLHHW